MAHGTHALEPLTLPSATPYLPPQETREMPKNTLTRSFHRTFAALAAAARAASAVESHRTPSGEDLRTLGIDREQFRRLL